MKIPYWHNENEFSVGGVDFLCALHDYSLKTDDERVVILKDKRVLDHYIAVLSDNPPKNVLEFGIFQGGSPILFSLMFDLQKFVGIDISEPAAGLEAMLRKQPVGERIKTYYEVSQVDRHAVDGIIAAEFGETPIDLIIDDASHEYELTKQTFEIAFPRLKAGGTYVIEDWGWAHWPGSHFFEGKTAMSMLLFELVMVCASRSDIISEIRVFPSFAFIRKGEAAPGLDQMSISALYNIRGIEIKPGQPRAAEA